MQFHIRTLLVVTTVISVLLAVIFAAPPLIAIPILCAILWVCPSFWINGIIYGRGAGRPFFIGGVMAGIGPHLAAVYYSVMIVGTFLDSSAFSELMDPGSRWANVLNAAILLAPGLFALAGGLVGMGVYWLFLPARAGANAPTQPVPATNGEEYVVVTGRIAAHRLAELGIEPEGVKLPTRVEPASAAVD